MEQNFTITEAPFAGYQTNPKNRRFEGFSCTFPNTAKVKVLTFNELKHIKNPPAPYEQRTPYRKARGSCVMQGERAADAAAVTKL